MRIDEIAETFKVAFEKVGYVGSVNMGDVLRWNETQPSYTAVSIDYSGSRKNGGSWEHTFVIYCADRLEEGGAKANNEFAIWDMTIRTIELGLNYVRQMAMNGKNFALVDDTSRQYTNFTQHFADMLCGVMTTVVIKTRNAIGECTDM